MVLELRGSRQALPGGRIYETCFWVFEHCVGPLGVGTLLVKPFRHVTTLGDLVPEEAAELGAVLQQAAACARDLTEASQVYVCQWSHAGFEASHIHFVVQPVALDAADHFERPGPALQAAMFFEGQRPEVSEVEAFCDLARQWFERTI